MRILIVTEHFWPSVGGAEVMLRRLARAWAAADHEVTVLTGRWDAQLPAESRADGYPVVRLPIVKCRIVGTLWEIGCVRRWMMRHPGAFDIVYVSMLKHVAFAAVSAARRLGVPIVVRAEGSGATGDVAWLQSARFGRWIRRQCCRADVVVAVSDAVETELRTSGFDSARIHLLPNAVPIPRDAWQRADCAEHRSRLGMRNRPTICYAGRLHAGKGLEDLVCAVHNVASSGVDFGLLLVGEGPLRRELTDLIERLDIRTSADFAGAVDSVEPYLRASDLFVLPSYQEGLSVALLEALALGMPALASDIPGNRGLVENGLLPTFPPGDRIALAKQIREQVGRDMGTAAREQIARRFDLNHLASEHLALFRDLVDASDAARTN